MKTANAFALMSAIILVLSAIPADAQPYNRTFVSGTGSNSSMCGTRTAPCATFQAALANTASGGEVDCLDAGEFSNDTTVTVSKSLSIICDGFSNGGILNTADNGIIINAPSNARVYLSGLALLGGAAALGSGVVVQSASAVYIVHCSIRQFISYGVYVNSSTNPTRVIIKDSIIVRNDSGGVFVEGTGGAANALVMFNSIIDDNSNFAAGATANDNVVALTQSLLTGSPTGLDLANGASADLIGPSNVIAGTITGTTTSVPFK
jgi:Right handed beta helix region